MGWLSLFFGAGGLYVLIKQLGPPLLTLLAKYAAPETLARTRQAADEAKLKIDAATWERANETISRQGQQIQHLYATLDAQEARYQQEIKDLREEMQAEIREVKAQHTKELDHERGKRRELEQEVESLRTEVARLTKENETLRAQVGGSAG